MSKITLLDWCKKNGDYGEKIIKEYSKKNQTYKNDKSYNVCDYKYIIID